MKIGILCSDMDGSPKVLAETLFEFLKKTGQEPELFYKSKALKRLLPATKAKKKNIPWLFYKWRYYFKDKQLYNVLKKKDIIILCHTTPSVFQSSNFDIPKFKKIVGKPLLYYAVQYLENSPTQIEYLNRDKYELLKTFDYHLSITAATEIRNTPKPPWFQIGLYLKATGLKPSQKKEFYALVDFKREGYEKYRDEQIRALEELQIPYLSLEKSYPMRKIREIYRNASIFFIQFPEAYGMPIAECLACGSYIGTPESSWAMSWRLDEKLEIHGPGKLAECFLVYNDYNDLVNQLSQMKDSYDVIETPKKVFKIFTDNYGDFYYGNEKAVKELYEEINKKMI